jgi:hypothetical protein
MEATVVSYEAASLSSAAEAAGGAEDVSLTAGDASISGRREGAASPGS